MISPWIPMNNPTDVKALGKLLEELGELTAAVSRCLIQGIDEREPITGKSNRLWLEEEMADVDANLEIVFERFQLNGRFILDRSNDKYEKLQEWHAMTEEVVK